MAVLEAIGIEIEDDKLLDTMILAYNLCVEPQSLKALALRLAGKEMSEYSDIMGDTQYSLALDYLCRVAGAEDAPLVELLPAPVKTPRKTKKNPNPIAIVPEPVFVRAWPDPDPIIEQNGNGVHIRKAQGVTKLVNRILSDIASGKTLKGGEATDPRDRWNKLDNRAKAPVVAAIGDIPEPALDDIPLEKTIAYAGADSDAQLRITPILLAKVKAMGLEECSKMDHDCLPVLYRMKKVGIQLAPLMFWDEIERDCQAQMSKAQYKIFQATGREINPNSGDQVADLLYGPKDKGGLGLVPPMWTEGGESGEDSRGSTGDKCLQALLAESPIVEFVADYREAAKVLGTYVVPLREASQAGDGRVRCQIKYTRTATGRFSAVNPNLLAIPVRSKLGERCRYGFVAPEGKVLYDSDLVQIEMKLAAHESRDETMMKVYRNGGDVHTTMAARAFSVPYDQVEKHQRQAGKICGFGILNGMTAKGLVNQLVLYHAAKEDGSKWSEDDCEMLIKEWFATYPGIRRFQQDCVREAQQTGIARESIAGRIRYLPQVWSPNRQVREEAERISYSHRIQSGANAILRRAMKASWDVLKNEKGVEMLLVIHDEKLFELPDNEDMRTLVETAVNWAFTATTKLRVPITAEGNFGPDWGSAH
jgi:DNA polymerase-1